MIGYLDAETLTAEGANGVSYAYRRPGPASGRPLVLLQHFRGNLENWDPILIDVLSSSRDVIVFDNTGVGRPWGATPTTVAQMADDAIVFLGRSAWTRSTCSGSPSAVSSRRRSP